MAVFGEIDGGVLASKIECARMKRRKQIANDENFHPGFLRRLDGKNEIEKSNLGINQRQARYDWPVNASQFRKPAGKTG